MQQEFVFWSIGKSRGQVFFSFGTNEELHLYVNKIAQIIRGVGSKRSKQHLYLVHSTLYLVTWSIS